jgi:endoglucanase
MKPKHLWILLASLMMIFACKNNNDKSSEEEGDDPGECSDGADNDMNGLFDCDDPNCQDNEICLDDGTSMDSDIDGDTDGDTDTDTDGDTDTDTDGDTDTDTDGDTDTDTDGDTDTDTDGDTDGDTDTDADADADTDADADADTDADADADGDADDEYDDKKFRGVNVVDKDFLMVDFKDGEVLFIDDGEGACAYKTCNDPENDIVVRYGEPLDTALAQSPASWTITSEDDDNYGSGLQPVSAYRKSKLNGMAQGDWVDANGDYTYDYTVEHHIILELPYSLQPGSTYTLTIDSATNTDVGTETFTYDIFNSRSEAIHVNLSGYHPHSAIHSADLYIWMGDGGARDYSSFEGNMVYLYNVETGEVQEVGQISFWMANGEDVSGHNLIQSDVWNVDFTGDYTPGVYRLVVEDVGASQDFVVSESALFEPFKVSILGFFYMRIGQDNLDMTPVPRRPLWIPGSDPADCRVVVTELHPYHPDWWAKGIWDGPEIFADYVLSGSPENPNAKGGHSDALDWDRHLEHVSIIYDMLLPYILTRGALSYDDLGIAESGNGVPDIIDEARDEVDLWLSLRYDEGYSNGLSNPDESTHILYQAGNTAMAAWANATNAAMLAEAYRISGHTELMNQYLDAAVEAWNHVSGLSDQMLDDLLDIGDVWIRGRDFRMTAAAYLYNLTGNTDYEDIVSEESLVENGTSNFQYYAEYNQLYAMAAYLQTEQEIHYPTLHENMRKAAIYHAREMEIWGTEVRPSRRATDNDTGFFHTAQNVQRAILAHAVATDPSDKLAFERAMVLEFDWGLGRNPANVIQMTTASTALAGKHSIESAYTSGRDDGTPGMHPGHTPYMNLGDWGGMIMAQPSWMIEKSYPTDGLSWPKGELYFDTRYVWAHSEFTPQQTMRGKAALYGYLVGMSR